MAAVRELPPPGAGQKSGCGSHWLGGFVPEKFPVGMRVLVVDDDITCLMILREMLQKCRYEVTTCTQATVALSLLREKKGNFDIVISDVHMQDMDGFKLLENVGLEMDLPVIMMSADGRTSSVMRGIHHGACDYLIKPVRIEELRNIWQHVVRKRWSEYKESEHSSSLEDSGRQRQTDEGEHASSINDVVDNHLGSRKKKRDTEDDDDDYDNGVDDDDGDMENDDSSSSKKPRVVWSVELHQQFVNAVHQLGIDKAVPKRILELMNVPGLTRENVASHLQKFRLYLKRLNSVGQQPGNPMTYHGPGREGTQAGSPYGLDFQSLVASGQISPQTLAALHAELLGQPSGSFILPAMTQTAPLQTSIQASMHVPHREIASGQVLLKCQNSSSVNGETNTIVPDLSTWLSSNYISREVLINNDPAANNNQNGDSLMPMQQQMSKQKQQHLPNVASQHEANIQSSCLVVPSQVSYNFEFGRSNQVPLHLNSLINSQSLSSNRMGSCSVSYNPISGNNGRAVDNGLLPSQLESTSVSVGEVLDGNMVDTGVLTSYPVLRSPSYVPAEHSNSSSAWRFQHLPINTDPSANLPYLVPSISNSLVPSAKLAALPHLQHSRNLGFSDSSMGIPRRFAAEDIEVAPNDLRYGKNVGRVEAVQQDIHAEEHWRMPFC